MDFFTRFRRQLFWRVFLTLVFGLGFIMTIGWFIRPHLNAVTEFIILGAAGVIIVGFLSRSITTESTKPIEVLWQATQHIKPENHDVAAPDLESVKLGHDVIKSLVNQLYQLATVSAATDSTTQKHLQDLHANFLANALPLPLVVLNKTDTIVYVNEAASTYFGTAASELAGQNIYSALDMSFADDQTLEVWLKGAKQKAVTATSRWERVRIGLPGQKDNKQFDLAAHYNKSNPLGYETLLVLFDHTEIYSQDDQAMSFVALTVHELRTPLTLLRGYIEVFDEEVGPMLNSELKNFMQKMNAAAQQLTSFVDNILNVAKIEDNQLTLQLRKDSWPEVLDMVVSDLSLRAQVRNITIKTDIAKDLPLVGVDRYSIYEVLANLIDNAIKYSRGTGEIYVTARLNDEGLVETSVKDFGLGIDGSILPHVFEKFYRNHRNRAQIGGTGLGLFLSRAIVQAHGGQIWVRSKVDQGSTFTFTVLPFEKLSEMGDTDDSEGLTRGAHGWIKNHSLYRD